MEVKGRGLWKKKPAIEKIASRVVDVQERLGAPAYVDGVHPLNPSFFQLEAMRALQAPKQRADMRKSRVLG